MVGYLGSERELGVPGMSPLWAGTVSKFLKISYPGTPALFRGALLPVPLHQSLLIFLKGAGGESRCQDTPSFTTAFNVTH